MVPCAFVSRGSMVTRIAGNRSVIIPLLAEEGWRVAPGGSRPKGFAGLQSRLRPDGLPLRATPSAPLLARRIHSLRFALSASRFAASSARRGMHHQPTPSFQEWIVPSFVTDGCGLAVAGDDECIVIERHELSFDRSDDV